ncbi:glyoxylate carboligase (plasmid) [Streptomyces sp. BHT-5-2]|uniref:thiamine pyrophosphate-binding protein n=1 Tax=Streptomyces sp. BHT-5-2 TaxID=2866715 RepID=UPI001C8D315F|nr:thiamine pyrophosphate-binding protein [Streptomyces sp. BHT-5-2]QZL08528.1 glyoxylate carboligase [Streptomyces sp. BHT-5-2]
MGARRIPAVQAAVEIMKDEGADTVFGCPGAALLPLYAAMERAGGIAHLSAGHAEGAAHMADGWARTTGRAGVAAVAGGPGAVRLLSGLYAAQQDAVPLVCVTGRAASVPPAPAVPLRHAGHRPPDLVRLAGALTKRAERIEDPARIPGAFREAFRIARAGRPGPVLIDVPADLAAAEIVCGPGPVAPSAPGAGPALVDGDRSPAPGAVVPLAVPADRVASGVHRALVELAEVFGGRSPADTHVVSGLPEVCAGGAGTGRRHRVPRRNGPPGWEVPTAIGVRKALDSRGERAAEVVVVVDGRGFPLTAGELAAAAQYEVPFVVVLLGGPEDADPFTDPVKLAEAYGCTGRDVLDPAELRSAVEWARKEAVSTRRPVLVEVRTERAADARGGLPAGLAQGRAYGT